jgi:hypothetical protein
MHWEKQIRNVKAHLNNINVGGVFKKRTNFLNNAPNSTEGALQLLSAPSGRFLQQTAICPAQ